MCERVRLGARDPAEVSEGACGPQAWGALSGRLEGWKALTGSILRLRAGTALLSRLSTLPGGPAQGPQHLGSQGPSAFPVLLCCPGYSLQARCPGRGLSRTVRALASFCSQP